MTNDASSATANYFSNTASWASEAMAFFIDPFRERQINYLLPDLWNLIALATFRFFSAAVLAEPAVAEIEEVRSLVH